MSDHPAFRGGLAISGVFDLEPIALNYLNDKLQLTAAEVEALSPLRNVSSRNKSLRIAVGGDELPEFLRQSEAFAAELKAHGVATSLTILPSHTHFTILDELAAPDGALTRELKDMIANSWR